jgi:hypothetical protein
MHMRANAKELEAVLFDALRVGYVSDVPPEAIVVDGVRYKRFLYKSPCERFTVEDRWISMGEIYSAGRTLITEEGQSVWIMQYYGWYRAEASDFLKRALRRNYCDRVFHGGRGRSVFTVGRKQYTNAVECGSNFWRFNGREAVMDCRTATALGEHRYHGGILVDG